MPELLRPSSIDEAADLIARHGAAAAVLAGGTSLMRETYPSDGGYLIGVDRLGLDKVVARDGGWSVGAAVSLSVLREAVPIAALQAATREIGGPAVQNMATVGGNLFARAPFGDLAPALLALGARLVFATADGETTQPIEDFYAGWADGAPPSTGLLISGSNSTAPAGDCAYMKCARRRYSTPSVVTVAACVQKGRRHGVGRPDRAQRRARAAYPLRCCGAGGDRLRLGRSGHRDRGSRRPRRAVEPQTDAVATGWYRRRMTGVFVGRVLAALA